MFNFCIIGKYCGILIFYLTVNNVFAQNKFKKEVYRGTKDSLLYNILDPVDYKSEKKGKETIYPLVVFLHGAGERGSDNEIQTIHIRSLFLDNDNQLNYPSFVLVPQCPTNRQWVNLPWSGINHSMPEVCSETMDLTIELIGEIIKKHPIDTNRIYISGVSMGGYGTWDIISRYPQKFAAAIPICGGGDTSKAKLLKDIPIWAFHGSSDKVVSVENTRNMIKAIKIAGGNPKYTEYAKVGHDSWVKTYKEGNLLEWLFKQKKAEN